MPRKRPALSVDVGLPLAARQRAHTRHMDEVDADASSLGVSSRHLSAGICQVHHCGSGASGDVSLGIFVPTLKLVAVKQVCVDDEQHEQATMRELHAVHHQLVPLDRTGAPSWLFHYHQSIGDVHPCPHIVSYYGSWADRATNRVNMVLEYMHGGSLAGLLPRGQQAAQEQESWRRPSEVVLRHIARCCLAALAHMQRHDTVHRDIKPDNILVNHAGHVKLGDLGLACHLHRGGGGGGAPSPPPPSRAAEPFDYFTSQLEQEQAQAQAQAQELLTSGEGTALYLSPERVRGGGYGCPADIWALGLTLFTLCDGRHPFHACCGDFLLLEDAVLNKPPPRLTGGSPSPPSEMAQPSSSEWSVELTSLLECMLCTEPDSRWDAPTLLRTHPFVVVVHDGCHTAAAAAGEGEEERGAKEELCVRLGMRERGHAEVLSIARAIHRHRQFHAQHLEQQQAHREAKLLPQQQGAAQGEEVCSPGRRGWVALKRHLSNGGATTVLRGGGGSSGGGGGGGVPGGGGCSRLSATWECVAKLAEGLDVSRTQLLSQLIEQTPADD